MRVARVTPGHGAECLWSAAARPGYCKLHPGRETPHDEMSHREVTSSHKLSQVNIFQFYDYHDNFIVHLISLRPHRDHEEPFIQL